MDGSPKKEEQGEKKIELKQMKSLVYKTVTGQAALQFSQIMEEEHESESGATNSICHSRCVSHQ